MNAMWEEACIRKRSLMLLKISPRQAGQQAKAIRWTRAISGWQGVVDRYYIVAGVGTMVYLQVGKCHRWGLENMRSPCHLGDPHEKKWWEWKQVVGAKLQPPSGFSIDLVW